MTQKPFTLLSLPAAKNTSQVIKKFPFPIKLTKGSYSNIAIIVHDKNVEILHNDIDIKNFSFVWLSSGWNHRDTAYAINLYFNHTQTPHSYVEKNSSKVTDNVIFALNDLPIPNTVFVSRAKVLQNMPLIKKVCGFPLIIKDIRGSQGKHSAFISSEMELLEKMQTLPKSKKFIFQQFIPNEYDWGIMIANGVVVAGEKSYPANGEFRNNTCNGARECFVDVINIPENIKELAIRASNLLGLYWSRTDIIIDKNTGLPYILEVNRFPGITSDSHEVQGAYIFLASHIQPSLPNTP